jgi:branched-chain amino acid aminotransferase
MDIRFEKAASLKAKPADESKLGFGHVFTDYMFIMDYTTGKGWHDARIVPYGDLSLSPAALCLHYGQEVFEGLKAYRREDGEIQLFRPEENFKRLNSSNERLVIPELPVDMAMEGLMELLKVEKDWVPHIDGASLYIRPFIIAVDPFLGVKPGDEYMFIIILSPSGAYYASGLDPVKIYVESQYVRAVRGGMRYTQTGGNYAASLIGQDEAHKEGYSQVLWLDGVEQKYIEEVGAMNMMFLIGDTIVTAALEGSILPGITRASILTLAHEMGIKVEERKIAIDEIMELGANGGLTEAFGTGTAAVVSPVGELTYRDKSIIINNGEIGALTQKFYNMLTSIQWGNAPDTHGWVTRV